MCLWVMRSRASDASVGDRANIDAARQDCVMKRAVGDLLKGDDIRIGDETLLQRRTPRDLLRGVDWRPREGCVDVCVRVGIRERPVSSTLQPQQDVRNGEALLPVCHRRTGCRDESQPAVDAGTVAQNACPALYRDAIVRIEGGPHFYGA